MNIKNTKSYDNIKNALKNESQALIKYSFYAEIAREEGNEDIALLFEKMATNEHEHARIWYKMLNDGFDDTLKNLEASAKSENAEWKSMYPAFAQQAREDGLETLAIMFDQIAAIECDHERKFFEATLSLREPEQKQAPTACPCPESRPYYCLFCGHCTDTSLDTCPVCGAQNSFSQ